MEVASSQLEAERERVKRMRGGRLKIMNLVQGVRKISDTYFLHPQRLYMIRPLKSDANLTCALLGGRARLATLLWACFLFITS